MKRILFALIISVLIFAGCGQSNALPPLSAPVLPDVPSNAAGTESQSVASTDNDDIIVISERLFIAQTNDIYINSEDYIGKTIQYEGIFLSGYWEEGDSNFYYVIRYGPGCCGYDGEAGFEVLWDGEYPEDNAWCQVTGKLEEYEEEGNSFLRLRLSSLTVLSERGAEYVNT